MGLWGFFLKYIYRQSLSVGLCFSTISLLLLLSIYIYICMIIIIIYVIQIGFRVFTKYLLKRIFMRLFKVD